MAKFFFPTWKGWLLINPMRLLFQNPEPILGRYVLPGMRVLDLGCSMGYFSLPLARMVGPQGRVYCLDCDQKQLDILKSRANKKGLAGRMEIICIAPSGEELPFEPGSLDLAVLLQVLHYMDDPKTALAQTYKSMKPGATLLVGEPKSHLSETDWKATLDMVAQVGFAIGEVKTMYNMRMAQATR